MFDIEALAGPIGGLIGLAYAAGATSGYAFCIKTMYKLIKERATKDEDGSQQRIIYLENQVMQLQERLINGQSRQLHQIRESSDRVLHSELDKAFRRID